MSTATNNLENDHIHIIRLTELMTQMAILPQINPDHVEEVIFLITNFADGLHHAKEEKLLFPLLEEKGFSTQSGPVAVMLAEHVQGREYVKQMREGLQQHREGNPDAVMHIKRALMGYAQLLQQHIDKENSILFRMASQMISEQEDDHLKKEFKKVDSGETTGTSSQEFVGRLERLIKAY